MLLNILLYLNVMQQDVPTETNKGELQEFFMTYWSVGIS